MDSPSQSETQATDQEWCSKLLAAINHSESALSHAEDSFIETGLRIGNLRALIPLIFPAIGSAEEFYSRLAIVAAFLGWDHSAFILTGRLWAAAILSIGTSKDAKLLSEFPVERQRHFFHVLCALPEVLSQVELSSELAIPWFRRLRKRIGSDGANQGFWDGIKVWARRNPHAAARSLQELASGQTDDEDVWMGGTILSSLRESMERDVLKAISEIEREWPISRNSTVRLIHHRSWRVTAGQRALFDEELTSFLSRIERSDLREVAESFAVVHMAIHHRCSSDALEAILQWIADNSGFQTDDTLAYWVCSSAREVCSRSNPNSTEEQISKFRSLVVACQPVPYESAGAWVEIEKLLAFSINEDATMAKEFLLELFCANPASVMCLLSPNGHGAFRKALYQSPSSSDFLTGLFDYNIAPRKLALALIAQGFPLDLTNGLEGLSDDALLLGILQMKADVLDSAQSAEILLQIAQHIEKRGPRLNDVVKQELVFHAKNLPGYCRDRYATVAAAEVVADVIKEIDAYFSRLTDAAESPVSAFEVPGLNRARRYRHLRQSRIMSEKIQDSSPILRYIPMVHLVYGSEGSADYRAGVLSPPTPFVSSTVTTEFPRLTMLDPEGKKLEWWNCINEIIEIQKRLAASLPCDES